VAWADFGRSDELFGLALGAIRPAFAVGAVIAGGIDPGVGITAIVAWFLATVASGAIIGICAMKGVHATAEGRSFMPHVGYAFAGTVLCFGGGYALAAY